MSSEVVSPVQVAETSHDDFGFDECRPIAAISHDPALASLISRKTSTPSALDWSLLNNSVFLKVLNNSLQPAAKSTSEALDESSQSVHDRLYESAKTYKAKRDAMKPREDPPQQKATILKVIAHILHHP